MNTEIYYFSGTGNSLHVARELQKRLPDTKLIPILSLLDKESIETQAETVGFVFPIYLANVPVPVRKFLRKLDLRSSQSIFTVATRIGTFSLARIFIEKMLRKKGKRLNSFFYVNMANNSPAGLMPANMPGVKEKAENWIHEISEESIAKLESEVQNQLDSIQKDLMNQWKNPGKTAPIPLKNLWNSFISLLAAPMESLTEHNKAEIHFYADPKCSGCGTCEKVCLAKKIQMVHQKPVWQKDIECYYCYACFNFCPKQSILIKDIYSKQNGRYCHPGITAHDIGGQK